MFGSGNYLTKYSDLAQWIGVEPIDNMEKSWNISSLSLGTHFFSARVSGQTQIEDSGASIDVIVRPTLTAVSSCSSSQPIVVLNWTDLSSTYSGVYYNVYRNDPSGTNPIVQVTTNSF